MGRPGGDDAQRGLKVLAWVLEHVAARHFLQLLLVKTILLCEYFAAEDLGASPPGDGTPTTEQAGLWDSDG